MLTRGSNCVPLLGFLLLLSLLSVSPLCTALVITYPDNVGPFIDSLVFKVTEGDDDEVLALLNDEVDLIGDVVDPSHLPTLESAEDIEVAAVLRNGYGYLTIKTDKYPLNITDFRRAFAFAFDKARICQDVWDGLAAPQDSIVPRVNPYSIEGLLPYNYYDPDVVLGNDLLDDAGFLDTDSDGWREAPNGSDFDITIEVASSSPIAIDVGTIAAEALVALDVQATSVPTDFYEYLNRLYFHGDFDIVFLGASFTSFDVDWLAYEFWSEYADEPYQNFACWRNATYDSWRDQLLYSNTFEEVYEAASKMQEIWIHACPEIVCYENFLLNAYRTDRFDGHVNDAADGVSSWWTNYKVHLKESEGGPLGGTIRWSRSLDLGTLNFMVSCSCYGIELSDYLYDSLLRIDPDGVDIPWLAESYMIEMHEDNPDVTEGHTRLTFSIVDNATWTDGIPLTAEDVAFTLDYYRDAPGNPYGVDLDRMTAAFLSGPDTVVVDFETESYWHLHTIGYKPIIPKHVFEEIGLEGWNTWDPTIDELVTSGPFVASEYVAGNYSRLTANPDYFRGADRTAPALGHPSNLTYVQESIGNVIVWPASDLNPVSYIVYRNGTVYDAGLWTGGNITVEIDGLGLGAHNITLCVFDAYLNPASDTVWVTVIASSVPVFGPLSLLSLGITVASSAVIVVFIGLTVSSRRGGPMRQRVSGPG